VAAIRSALEAAGVEFIAEIDGGAGRHSAASVASFYPERHNGYEARAVPMDEAIWVAVGIGALYLWLAGHWFGWVLAFLASLWLLHSAFDAPDGAGTACRLLIGLAITGVPCVLWGSI